MAIHREEKLNSLLFTIPEGVLVPSKWLVQQGYSRQILNGYARRGWLEQAAHGVYYKPGSKLDWQSIALGLQHYLNHDLYLGGKTALELQGYAQYLRLGSKSVVELWGSEHLPGWVTKVSDELNTDVLRRNKSLFKDSLGQEFFTDYPSRVRDWTIRIAKPELAILEVLSLVTHSEDSFVHAAELMQGLSTLRPKLLNRLLQSCTHVKTKRLFCFLASYFQYSWFKHLDLEQVDLGSGKREVTKGGVYNSEFQITVPKDYQSKF